MGGQRGRSRLSSEAGVMRLLLAGLVACVATFGPALLPGSLVSVTRAASFGDVHSFGDVNSDVGASVAVDGAGNTYLTGTFSGTVDVDPGPSIVNLTSNASSDDIFVLKLDTNGSFRWAHSVGSAGTDQGLGIAIDGSGNVYLMGAFGGPADFDPGPGTANLMSNGSSDIFVLKLDANGGFLWARSVGGAAIDEGLAVDVDGSGNVYLTGHFQGTVDFDPGPGTVNLTSNGGFDFFVLKLDAIGNFVWAHSFGGAGSDLGSGIAVDGSGNVYLTGFFGGTADFDPGSGIVTLTSNGSSDIFVLKLDAIGNFVWARSVGGASSDTGLGIAVDGSGNVYLTGFFIAAADFDPGSGIATLTSNGSADIFVLKLDTNGSFVWARSVGGANSDTGRAVAVDFFGDVYLTGNFSGIVDFDPGPGAFNLIGDGGSEDIFALKLDTNGSFVWAHSVGSTATDEGHGVAVDGSGSVYLTGFFTGTVDFDPGPGPVTVTSAGSSDVFAMKLIQVAPPVNSVLNPQVTREDTPLVFSAATGNKLSIADADNGSSPLVISLTVTNGTLMLHGTSDLSFSLGDGTADPSMTFTGTLVAINTALDGLIFTPAPNFNGSASLQISSFDLLGPNRGQTDADTLAITITPVNDAPVAVADSYGVGNTRTLTVAAPGVLANDTDIDSPTLGATKVTDPVHGSLTFNAAGGFSYAPSGDFAGIDSFTYLATDGTAASTPATVSITVGTSPPTASPDSFTVVAGTPLTATAPGVLANDADPDAGTTLQAQLVAGTPHGNLALSPDGGFIYRPNDDFAGTDSFSYRASDGIATSSPVTVNIVVTPLRCAPRPRVVPRPVAGGGKLNVHVEATASSTPENNRLLRVDFGQFQNARVTLNSQPIVSGQTFIVADPINTHGVDFTVERVTAGQPTTVPFTVTDDCGSWPTFVGGGTAAGF